MIKKVEVFNENDFSEKQYKKLLVHDSPYFRVINFNFKAGQELPMHSHDFDGQLSITVLEGRGEFLGAENASIKALQGDVLISDISEPQAIRAETDMRVLVTISPPI